MSDNPRWNPYNEYSMYYTARCGGLCFEDGANDWFDHESEIHQQLMAEWWGLTEMDCSCCDYANRLGRWYTEENGYCNCVCHER